jgi:hypothetical protein
MASPLPRLSAGDQEVLPCAAAFRVSRSKHFGRGDLSGYSALDIYYPVHPNGLCSDLAEGEGFEPSEACASLVFKTSTFVRSVTPPTPAKPVVLSSEYSVPGSRWSLPCVVADAPPLPPALRPRGHGSNTEYRLHPNAKRLDQPRRGWDLNPRDRNPAQRFSRPSHSSALSPLLAGFVGLIRTQYSVLGTSQARRGGRNRECTDVRSLSVYLRSAKKLSRRSVASLSRTPATTSHLWLRRSSWGTLNRLQTAPAFGSAAA